MRRCSDRRALTVLLEALPSYLSVYEELCSRHGERLPAEVLFAEVAKEADELLYRSRRHDEEVRLESIAEAMDRVVTDPRVDAASVIEDFLSRLSPAAWLRFDAYLRPVSARLAGDGEVRNIANDARGVSPATPPPLRPRPRRYSGRAPRRRRRL